VAITAERAKSSESKESLRPTVDQWASLESRAEKVAKGAEKQAKPATE